MYIKLYMVDKTMYMIYKTICILYKTIYTHVYIYTFSYISYMKKIYLSGSLPGIWV